jgi:hypothetical protein
MKVIYKKYNLLEEHEIDYLNKLCENYVTDSFQIYNMQTIKNGELVEFKDKIIKYVATTYGDRYELSPIWINKVTPDDVGSDKFHFDRSALSIVTYFNLDFEGGQFEYIDKDNNKIIINPEINLSLIMDDTIWHRITKVTRGKRFSLVSFFKLTSKYDKQTKTLI